MHRITSAATEARTPIVTSWFSAPPPPTCGATGRRNCNTLFERAVVLGHKGERDESLREQLAKFLHDHHPRTLPR
jgi:hypothetical protein